MSRVYLSPPHMSGRELAPVQDAFKASWIAPLGPHVDAFERELAEAVAVPFATALSSGTAGLHLAMRILGVEKKNEVIYRSLTFSASANPIAYEGATPIFVDCDSTWTVDPGLLEEALKAANARGKRPRAVISFDLCGQCADYEAIEAICGRWGIPLVEDAAEDLGATHRGQPAGGFGRIGV